MSYAIKAEVADPTGGRFVFDRCKTMYGGKKIGVGDTIYIFASENCGGRGLVARGLVTSAEALPKPAGAIRHTPRVRIAVERTGIARRSLGRAELKQFGNWDDGRPETELNFKFYRQATDKIVGLSDTAAGFLETFFAE